jgi:hypothetical protein
MNPASFHCLGPDADGCELTCPDYQHHRGRPTSARLFVLDRDTDVSGISGTGVVADGVVWPNEMVTLCWRGENPSVVVWQSLDAAMAIHGHDGATRCVFVD